MPIPPTGGNFQALNITCFLFNESQFVDILCMNTGTRRSKCANSGRRGVPCREPEHFGGGGWEAVMGQEEGSASRSETR